MPIDPTIGPGPLIVASGNIRDWRLSMNRRIASLFGRLSVAVVVSSALVVVVPEVGPAFAAVSLTAPPERLYMAPDGTTLIAALVGVPITEMAFTGQDIISGDDRELVVVAEDGPLMCDPKESNDWDINDCTRIQMDVSHGTLEIGAITTEMDSMMQPVYVLAGGAVVDQYNNPPSGPTTLIHINGTQDQLNAALADLKYIPDTMPDLYYYNGSNPETLNISVISGLDSSTADYDVEIRVLDVNDFPFVNTPASPIMADVAIEEEILGYTAGDEDNDENVDGMQADPPVMGDDPIDGAGTDLLLIGVLDCGLAVSPNQGFHYQGGTFQTDPMGLQALLESYFDVLNNPDLNQVVTALVTAIEAIDPDLNIPLSSTNPTDYTTAFVGIGEMDDLQYALEKMYFLHDKPSDSCDLITVVSDLGNNGLPLQYIGSPPSGFEIPFFGFNLPPSILTITTGPLQEIDASFAGPIFTPEGGSADVTINITPATHPAFNLILATSPGTATPSPGSGSDYQSTSNLTVSIAENQTTAMVGTNVFDDIDQEGAETFTWSLATPMVPPAGWVVNSATPSALVTILDDDDFANNVSVSDAMVTEGNSGTTNLAFTLTLSGPADGNEIVDVSTMNGSATTADLDYNAITNQMVTFSPGDIKPQTADQLSIGYFKTLKEKMYETFVEVYYKTIDNLLDFKDGANLILNKQLEADLLGGTGKSYGAEFSIAKNSGRLNGTFNYTYSRSLRQIKGETDEQSVNKGKVYASNFDQPHIVNLSWRYGITKRYFFTGFFTYHTGRPVTIPLSGALIENFTVANFSDRNSHRIPSYHRLDLALIIEGSHKRKKFWDGTWSFSVYNVYARKNAYSVFFKDDGFGFLRPYRLAIVGTVLPSISYSFKL